MLEIFDTHTKSDSRQTFRNVQNCDFRLSKSGGIWEVTSLSLSLSAKCQDVGLRYIGESQQNLQAHSNCDTTKAVAVACQRLAGSPVRLSLLMAVRLRKTVKLKDRTNWSTLETLKLFEKVSCKWFGAVRSLFDVSKQSAARSLACKHKHTRRLYRLMNGIMPCAFRDSLHQANSRQAVVILKCSRTHTVLFSGSFSAIPVLIDCVCVGKAATSCCSTSFDFSLFTALNPRVLRLNPPPFFVCTDFGEVSKIFCLADLVHCSSFLWQKYVNLILLQIGL